MLEYNPSARITRLRKRALADDFSLRQFQGWRGLLFSEAFLQAAGQPLVVQRALGLANVIDQMPVALIHDDMFVGHHYLGNESCDFPEFGWNEAKLARLEKTGLSEAERTQYHHNALTIANIKAPAVDLEPLPEEIAEAQRRGVIEIWGTHLNHSVRGYKQVLELGFEGLLEHISEARRASSYTDPFAARQRAFWAAEEALARAGCALGKRYAAALQAAIDQGGDAFTPQELELQRDVCLQVPAKPARTLREAIQALWFAHMITCWEDGINANSIGRIDQLLYPYYAADLAAGRITPGEAMELLAALWIKLYRFYDVQQAMVGGTTPDGQDACNDLSLMALAVTKGLSFVRCLSVRLHKQSPRELVELAVENLAPGGGIPFFFNDDTLIPALVRNGVAIEDARDFAAIGCIEITIPGRAQPHACSNWINLAKCLVLALFDGADPRDSAQLGPHTGRLADMRGIEDVWQAFTRQVEFFSAYNVYGSNRLEQYNERCYPLPYLSLLTEDCIARGMDISWGGARYDYHSTAAVGIPNVADSLAALEQLVFTRKITDPTALLQALKANFAGAEDLRQALLHRAAKYGNDNPQVDAWADRTARFYCELADNWRSSHGGKYFCHLFSYTLMLPFGARTGAMPDGRLAGTPLAYSVSAVQGRDEHGVTPMLLSLSRLPHNLAAASSSAIIEVDPNLLAEGEPRQKFVDLIQTAIRQGVGQMQWNVVNADTLRKAQADPEAYRSLCVRVSGYSQQFILLSKDMQEHVIARTKHKQ
ncbi:MAG: pyruvate formate lyase family protein [Anaerolineae bacterium]